MGIANKDRKVCKEFVNLATKLDKKSPPDPDDVEVAYVAAINEAQMLVTHGLLTVELPDEKWKEASKTDRQVSAIPASHQKYEIHPTAAIFPLMSDAALDELAADIKEHGLRDSVVMHNRRVIDGRNRLEACDRAGVEPTFTDWTGSGSVVTWILSVNLHRRHFSDQQRAMIAARVAQELAIEAKDRSEQNLRKSGDPVEGLNPTPRGEGKSTERAAKLLNVSNDATKKASKIAKSGSSELVQAVTEGKVSLDAAAQVASLPEAKQREVVAKGKVKEAAKKLRIKKAESKGKSKPAPEPQSDADEDEPEGEPTAPNDEVKSSADPVPPEAEPEESEDDVDTDPPAPSSPDELPLLEEAHNGLDKMVSAGRYAGRMENLIEATSCHCCTLPEDDSPVRSARDAIGAAFVGNNGVRTATSGLPK